MAQSRYVAQINLDNPRYFDGVEVAARQQALINTPLRPDGYLSPAIDQVLLVDEQTVYQCRKCGKHWPLVGSASAHQRSHSAKYELRKAQEEIEQLKEKELKAPKPTRARTNERGPDKRPRKTTQRIATRDAVVSGDGKVAVSKEWAAVIRRLKLLHDELDSLTIEATRLAALSSAPPVPKDVLEKAARWDQVKELFK